MTPSASRVLSLQHLENLGVEKNKLPTIVDFRRSDEALPQCVGWDGYANFSIFQHRTA